MVHEATGAATSDVELTHSSMAPTMNMYVESVIAENRTTPCFKALGELSVR